MGFNALLKNIRSVFIGDEPTPAGQDSDGPKMTKRLTIDGMSCGHCAMKVRSELEDAPGVESAQVDLLSRTAVVKGAGLKDADLAAAVAKAGYRLVAVAVGR